jgi:hypothetical protein
MTNEREYSRNRDDIKVSTWRELDNLPLHLTPAPQESQKKREKSDHERHLESLKKLKPHMRRRLEKIAGQKVNI